MIQVTRLDGSAFVLNAELIKFVEENPDTFVTLTTGDKVIVAESLEEITKKTIEYQQCKYTLPELSRNR